MQLTNFQDSNRKISSVGERVSANSRKRTRDRLTIEFEISPAMSLGEFAAIVAHDFENLPMVEIARMLDQCSKRELYSSLWYLEGKSNLAPPFTLPLFIRYLASERKPTVLAMIKGRIYCLEEKSVKAFNRRMRDKVTADLEDSVSVDASTEYDYEE